MPQDPVEDLLKNLDSPESHEAWSQFLSDYSAQMYQVIRHFETDQDNAADCFQFVCEQLFENRSRRLRKFKGEGAATFVTWLRAVVRNLCIDWHRRQFGRYRQFQSITRLSVFDQEVFRFIYEQAVPPEECLTILAAEYPNVSASRINESRARIDETLTANQRWILANRNSNRNGNDPTSIEQVDASLALLTDEQPDPEAQAIDNERIRRLNVALAKLNSDERLLIRLRFEEGLTLDQAAKLMGLGNAQRADRRVKEILERLQKLIG